MDFAEIFNLKVAERGLHTLICLSQALRNSNQLLESQRATHLSQVEYRDPQELLHLSFRDQNFDLVLCYGVLFQGSDAKSEAFDKKMLSELLRVGTELRISPIVFENGNPVNFLGSLIQSLQEQGLGIEFREVKNNQNNTNKGEALLRLWHATCEVRE